MKKRLLSALLALALVFVLLPTTALAETPAIKIAGTVIEDGKYYYTNGGIGELKTEAQQKTWNVRRDGNTLYLKNAKINTTDTQSIQVWMMSVTINLEGDSTITTKGEGSIVSQFAGSLTIKGNGKLTIESNTAGSSIVWNSGDVTITGDAVVNITNKNSGQLSEAIGLTNSYELTVSGNAKLKAVSNGSKAATVNGGNLTIADNAEFNVINQNSSGKAVSFKSIEVAAGYDCNGINGNGITDWTKTTAEELNTFQKVWVKPTPTPTLEESNVYVARTNLYKNTAYTIQEGKPVMGGTYPGNYNIYLDATNYVLHVKDAVIDATGTTGIYGTSNIVFEGTNSITASSYGIYSYFTSSDLKISGTGSLTVKTKASCPAIATVTNYTPKPSIEISGQGFTVTADTSGTTSPAITSAKDLTVKDGVTVKAASNATRAIDITGNLTVNSGATLTATSKSNNVPTVQVDGNASFTGSTVTITNNSDRQGKSGEYSYEVSTGLYVGGTLDIKNAAKVTSTVIGGNAIYAKGDITISGDSTEVNAQNSAYKFSAISTNGTVNISDNSTVKAENLKKHQGDPTGVTDPSTGKTYNACPAITGKIANKNSQNKLHIAGFTTSSAGSQNPTEGTPLYLDIAPGSVEPYIHHYYVTITRGDEVAHTESPIVIAGTTLRNDTYYTITDGSTVVANGSKGNYNAIYDSASKTLKLNNAQISHSFAHENGGGRDGAIIFKEFENYFIELSGENTISSTNTYAINCHRPDRTLTIKNAAEAENAKLTLTSNWMVICSIGGLNIQSDVTMVNTKEAGYLMYVNDTFSFDGYNAYASVNASGSPLVEYTVPTSGDKDAGYQYLRITKETLETGGGSTHQHTYDQSAWKSDATHHWQECTDPNCPDPTKGITNKAPHSFSNGTCTICGYRGQTEEHHFGTEWISDAEYHWHECTDKGCNAISGKAPHEWTGWRIDEPMGMHNRFCNCGYNDYSHHYNLVYAAAGEAGHYQYCTLGNCTFKTSTVPHNYDGDTCTICNYTKSGEIVPPTPDNPGTIVIIRPAEEEKPAQQPNPSTGANDLVGLAVAAAVAAALGSAALLRKHD